MSVHESEACNLLQLVCEHSCILLVSPCIVLETNRSSGSEVRTGRGLGRGRDADLRGAEKLMGKGGQTDVTNTCDCL